MHIRRYRYAWEPTVYHSADGGAGAGGNNGDPPAGSQQGGDGKGQQQGNQDGGDGGGGQGGDPPKPEAKFTQADIDRAIAQRLEEEKRREKSRTERARAEAAEEAAKKNGEWEKVAEARQTRISELESEIESLKAAKAEAELATVRERVAAKHKLPPALAARLRGKDESELEADARELAKLVVVKAPNTEAGAGSNGGGKGSLLDSFIADRNQVAASAPNPLARTK